MVAADRRHPQTTESAETTELGMLCNGRVSGRFEPIGILIGDEGTHDGGLRVDSVTSWLRSRSGERCRAHGSADHAR